MPDLPYTALELRVTHLRRNQWRFEARDHKYEVDFTVSPKEDPALFVRTRLFVEHILDSRARKGEPPTGRRAVPPHDMLEARITFGPSHPWKIRFTSDSAPTEVQFDPDDEPDITDAIQRFLIELGAAFGEKIGLKPGSKKH